MIIMFSHNNEKAERYRNTTRTPMSWKLWLIIFLIKIGSNEYASFARKCAFKSLTSRYYRWRHLTICVMIFWWECKLYKIKKKILFPKV